MYLDKTWSRNFVSDGPQLCSDNPEYYLLTFVYSFHILFRLAGLYHCSMCVSLSDRARSPHTSALVRTTPSATNVALNQDE